MSANVERRPVGALVEVLPRVGPDGLVQLDLHVEESRLAPPEAVPADVAPPVTAPVFTTLTVRAALAVPAGRAVLATGDAGGGAGRRGQTAIVVAVRLAEAGEGPRR
jgi:hypothetical protein